MTNAGTLAGATLASVYTAVFLGGAFTTADGGTVVNRLELVDATTGIIRP